MSIDKQRKRQFMIEAHALKPVVIIGNKGLTASVLAEMDVALNHHELIKVKIAAERDERKQIIQEILEQTGADLIQNIGQVAVLYRKKPEEK
ncbi:MAG: uncharacterized protein K0S29_762 [Gammaproteobacteria bacterium]|jgi:RNA-binding protein|nr:uncharacterized protein [Gammaproteobacteria bacterium]